MGDYVNVSLKRGERPRIEDILERTLKGWNGESKDNREIFKKADVWKYGLELVDDMETSHNKTNNPNIKPIIAFKQMIIKETTKEIMETNRDIKLINKDDFKTKKRLKLHDYRDVIDFKKQSEIYLVLLKEFRARINEIYDDNFKDSKTKKS